MSTISKLDRVTRRRIGLLAEHALNQLWQSNSDIDVEDDDQPSEDLGCCPACCGPCSVLAGLYLDGELDAWIKESPLDPSSSYMWDGQRDRVDRAWLRRSWSHTDKLSCHEGLPDQVAAVRLLLDALDRNGTDA